MNIIKSVKLGKHKDNHNVGKQNICTCRSSCKVSATYRRLQPNLRCIDKIPNVSFHENSSVGSLAVPADGWKVGEADVMTTVVIRKRFETAFKTYRQ